jgi:hypothetical protein
VLPIVPYKFCFIFVNLWAHYLCGTASKRQIPQDQDPGIASRSFDVVAYRVFGRPTPGLNQRKASHSKNLPESPTFPLPRLLFPFQQRPTFCLRSSWLRDCSPSYPVLLVSLFCKLVLNGLANSYHDGLCMFSVSKLLLQVHQESLDHANFIFWINCCRSFSAVSRTFCTH